MKLNFDWVGTLIEKDADDRERYKHWYSLSDEQKDTIEKLLESGALDSFVNPSWIDLKPIKITIENQQGNIPEACRHCSAHPSNGGSGVCLCTLGQPKTVW